jgi:hypothetical protein
MKSPYHPPPRGDRPIPATCSLNVNYRRVGGGGLGRRAQLSPGAGGGGSGRFGPRSGRRALAAICLAWELGSDECRDEEQEVEVDAVDGDGEPLRVRRLPGWARDRIAATRRPPAVRSPMREREESSLAFAGSPFYPWIHGRITVQSVVLVVCVFIELVRFEPLARIIISKPDKNRCSSVSMKTVRTDKIDQFLYKI